MGNCFVRVTSKQRRQDSNLPALAAGRNNSGGASRINAFGDAQSFARGCDGKLGALVYAVFPLAARGHNNCPAKTFAAKRAVASAISEGESSCRKSVPCTALHDDLLLVWPSLITLSPLTVGANLGNALALGLPPGGLAGASALLRWIRLGEIAMIKKCRQ